MRAEDIEVTGTETIPVLPEKADLRRLEAAQKRDKGATGEVIWLVAVYIRELPPAQGQLARLYLGDHWVRRYFGFKRGIYFKVYDPRFFDEHRNAEIRFVLESGEVVSTGLKLKDPRTATDAKGLTQQREVLARLSRPER